MLRRYFTVDMLSFLLFGVLHVLALQMGGGGGSRLIVSTVHRDADEDDSESVQ